MYELVENSSSTKVGILVYDDVDLLEVGGPYEVFLTAAKLAAREGAAAPFQVVTVGPSPKAVTTYGGLRLVPDITFAEAESLDVLVVPGAVAMAGVVADRSLVEAVGRIAKASSLVASVCGGAFILADLGLLEDRPWTAHWEDVAALAARVDGRGQPWARWVDAGDVVTSGGQASGIAMSLHLVHRLAGRDLAMRTARQIDYQWVPGTGGELPTRPARESLTVDQKDSSPVAARLRTLGAAIGARIGLLEPSELAVICSAGLIAGGWLVFDVMLEGYRMGRIPYLAAFGVLATVLIFHLRPNTVWSVPYPTLLRLGAWVIVLTALADVLANVRDGVLEAGGLVLAGALLYYIAAATAGVALLLDKIYSGASSRSSMARSRAAS